MKRIWIAENKEVSYGYLNIFYPDLNLKYFNRQFLSTVGAVGVAFVGLVSLMGVSPAITAGAGVFKEETLSVHHIRSWELYPICKGY